MPRINKSIARADIYGHGLKTDAENKQGYNLDRSKPEDENDKVIVKKGQTYYSWAFAYRPKQISLTYPKPRQLTQSDFMIQMYDIQDEIDGAICDEPEDFESVKDEIVSQIESLRDETQDKLDNMPESLQYSPTGELLQERVDACESWQSDIESIDADYEPYENDEDLSEEDNEIASDEHKQEWLDEKIEELKNCTCPL